MAAVPDTHPSITEYLAAGDFVVQQQNQCSYSQELKDQTIEQTMNRDSKTSGGQIGFSNNANAIHHWILSFSQCADISRSSTEMAGKAESYHKKTLVSPDTRRIKLTFKMSCIQFSHCQIHFHMIKKN